MAPSMSYLCLSLALFNILLAIDKLRPHISVVVEPVYTYIREDYPPLYPMAPLENVAISLYESTHFTLNSSDYVADQEWNLLSSIPKGIGRTRLGPEHRVFVLTFLHQMHCLRRIQLALIDRANPLANDHHVNHCLNYLRQTALCEAAETLEEGDFMERDFEAGRTGGDLVCKDWESALGLWDAKYEDWVDWKKRCSEIG